MAEGSGGGDPGWWEAIRRSLVYRHMPWKMRTDVRDKHPITVLRTLYLALFSAGPLILLVLTFIHPFGHPQPLLGAGLAVFGAISASGALWAWRRPLEPAGSTSLAADFRARFFLCFALSEVPMLVSFVASMVIEEYWPFLIGLAWFCIGMVAIAPSSRNLRRKDEELAARGSALSLTRALSEAASD